MKKIIPLSLYVLLIGCGENYADYEECSLREMQKFKEPPNINQTNSVRDYCHKYRARDDGGGLESEFQERLKEMYPMDN